MSLAGKRVVNTRAAHQAAALDELLRAKSAVPLSYPAIAIAPPLDNRPLDEILKRVQAGEFDLLVLTSANAVDSLAARAGILDVSLKNMPTAAVGTVTATAAREKLGVEIRLIPYEQNANALADALEVTPGTRILLPQAENAHSMLGDKFAELGAAVTAVVAYRTIRGSGGVKLVPLLNKGEVDAVTFISAAAVGYFVERVREEGGASFAGICAACLSERISHEAREHGFTTVTVAQAQTLDALVAALVSHYEAGR